MCDVLMPTVQSVRCATAESANPSVPTEREERKQNDNNLRGWGSRDHLRLAVLLQPIDGTAGEGLKACQ